MVAHISVALLPQAASTQVASALKRVSSAPASRDLSAVMHGQKDGCPLHIGKPVANTELHVLVAGTSVAGTSVAGTSVAGTSVAGTSMPPSLTVTSVSGASVAGTSVVGMSATLASLIGTRMLRPTSQPADCSRTAHAAAEKRVRDPIRYRRDSMRRAP